MDIEQISESFLLVCLQSNGSTIKEKNKATNDVIRAANIKAIYDQDDEATEASIECDMESEGRKAQTLIDELTHGWCLGEFQKEARRIENIIKKYQRK